jgi:hypothetical protein
MGVRYWTPEARRIATPWRLYRQALSVLEGGALSGNSVFVRMEV